MVSRIHYTEAGVEYVLQYNIRSDTIELRIIKYSLLGRFPNYFRHKSGTSFLEIATFKEVLRSIRTASGVDWFPELTEDEATVIHTFEEIADIHLLLTPKSVSKYYQTAMQGAANGLQAATESLRETARSLAGSDMSPIIEYMNGVAHSYLSAFARWHAENLPTAEEVRNITQHLRMPHGRQQQLRVDSPNDDDTETQRVSLAQLPGLDRTSILSYQDVFDRLIRVPYPENDVDASTPDPDADDADIDTFLKEIDETLSDTTRDSDEMWGAPTHTPYLDAETIKQLWKQANRTDNQPFRGQED